jgi:hypothetical protein
LAPKAGQERYWQLVQALVLLQQREPMPQGWRMTASQFPETPIYAAYIRPKTEE